MWPVNKSGITTSCYLTSFCIRSRSSRSRYEWVVVVLFQQCWVMTHDPPFLPELGPKCCILTTNRSNYMGKHGKYLDQKDSPWQNILKSNLKSPMAHEPNLTFRTIGLKDLKVFSIFGWATQNVHENWPKHLEFYPILVLIWLDSGQNLTP